MDNYVPQKVRECERQDCNYGVMSSVATLVYCPPIYDKNGNNLNSDVNITYVSYKCLTCGEMWRE